MSDKTPLERDIETHERYKTPVSVVVLIILLLLGLGVIGVYTFDLKQQLSEKEHQLVLQKKKFHAEKVDLLNRIKEMRQKPFK